MNRDESEVAEVEQAVREILVEHSACCVRRGAVGGLGDALMDDLAHRLAARDRVVAATAAETALKPIRALAAEWAAEGDEMSHWFAAQVLFDTIAAALAAAAHPDEARDV